MNTRLWALLLAAALCLSGCAQATPEAPASEAISETFQPVAVTEAPATSESTVSLPQPVTTLLTFVGDCTLGANPSNYYAGSGFIQTIGENYDYPFRNVAVYFQNDNATLANLEGPLTDSGNPADKTHTFRGPTAYSQILTEGSVDIVTLANNHTLDYGQTGYDSTVKTLQEANVPFVERDGTCLVTLNTGLKVGLYGMVYYDLNRQAMEDSISDLQSQGADLIVVAPHWGVEGSYRPTQEQMDLAHAAIDAGADIVWGSHPHVLQPIEEYKDGLILYSMGNFCFGGNGAPEDLDTVLIQQEVVKTPDGRVSLGKRKVVPCSIGSAPGKNNYQPTPLDVDSEGYDRVLRKLEGTFSGPNLKIRKIGK